MRNPGFEVKKTIRDGRTDAALRSVPFRSIARAILGEAYELSLVVCGDALATRINRTYRKRRYSPNVLSFPLDKRTGEIFLNARCAEREARRFQVALADRLALLFVHACFHLKGYDHGAAMERLESAALRRFGFKGIH